MNGEPIALRRLRDDIRNAIREMQDLMGRNDELGRSVPGLVWDLGSQLLAGMEDVKREIQTLMDAVSDDGEADGYSPTRRAATIRRQLEAFDSLLASQSTAIDRVEGLEARIAERLQGLAAEMAPVAVLHDLVAQVERLASGVALSTDIDTLTEGLGSVGGAGKALEEIRTKVAKLAAGTATQTHTTAIRQEVAKLGDDMARRDHVEILRDDLAATVRSNNERAAALEAELVEVRKELQALRRRITVSAKAPVLQLDADQLHQITKAVLAAVNEHEQRRAEGAEGVEGERKGKRRR